MTSRYRYNAVMVRFWRREKGRPLPDGPFPRGRCAVSLTFDDGMSSHIEVVAPLLDQLELRATFYLCAPNWGQEPNWRTFLAPWKRLHARGHEIGNHSLTHPCSQNIPYFAPTPGLESMTLEDIERDIQEAERRLRLGIPRNVSHSYAYPCHLTDVGRGAGKRSYVPVVAGMFPCARAGGDGSNSPLHCDVHHLQSADAHHVSATGMVEMIEETLESGRWLIFTFHGIDEGGGGLSTPLQTLQHVTDFLARHRSEICTAPVVDIGRHVATWQQVAQDPQSVNAYDRPGNG